MGRVWKSFITFCTPFPGQVSSFYIATGLSEECQNMVLVHYLTNMVLLRTDMWQIRPTPSKTTEKSSNMKSMQDILCFLNQIHNEKNNQAETQDADWKNDLTI